MQTRVTDRPPGVKPDLAQRASGYVTVRAAAELSGVPYRTIQYWISTGKIPAKQRSVRRVRLSDVRKARGSK